MHRLFLFLGFMVFSFIAAAQYPGYKAVSNTNAFGERFAIAASKIKTISSDFKQIKNLSLLKDNITSKGKFYYKNPQQVRMDYLSPYNYTVVINGSKVIIKDGGKTNSMSAKSNKMFQQINQLMLDCAKGSILNNKSFTTLLFENTETFLAEMKPLTKEMKNLFSKVMVTINKSNFLVAKIQMDELNGDKTTITYSNQAINTTINDALFTAP